MFSYWITSLQSKPDNDKDVSDLQAPDTVLVFLFWKIKLNFGLVDFRALKQKMTIM